MSGLLLLILIFVVLVFLVVPIRVVAEYPEKGIMISWFGFRRLFFEKRGTAPAESPPAGKRSVLRPMINEALADPSGLVDPLRKVLRFARRVLRAFAIDHLEARIVPNDPMIAGIALGMLSDLRHPKIKIDSNFQGENRLVGKFSIQLYRLIFPLTALLFTFPYRCVWRLYRKSRRAPEEVPV